MGKSTKADLAAREEARRNSEWLQQLAERAYEDLERRGALTVDRPKGPMPPLTRAQMTADRGQARANAEWLRQLAQNAKAELDANQPGQG
jgi:hypothetical protein